MSARIHDLDVSEGYTPDRGFVNVKALKEASGCRSAGMLKACSIGLIIIDKYVFMDLFG